MRRHVAQLAAVLLVVTGFVYVARPAGHVPPYDANLVRLAESALEGYCAGETFWNTGGRLEGNAAMAAACRKKRAGKMSSTSKLAAVPSAFCRAIIASGWEGFEYECLEILVGQQYWPTYDGGITDAWNRARPYPISGVPAKKTGEQNDSRTGERVEVPRSHPQRAEGS